MRRDQIEQRLLDLTQVVGRLEGKVDLLVVAWAPKRVVRLSIGGGAVAAALAFAAQYFVGRG